MLRIRRARVERAWVLLALGGIAASCTSSDEAGPGAGSISDADIVSDSSAASEVHPISSDANGARTDDETGSNVDDSAPDVVADVASARDAAETDAGTSDARLDAPVRETGADVVGVDGEAGEAGNACSTPPFATESWTLSEISMAGRTAKAGITITARPCDNATISAANGAASLMVPLNQPHYLRLSATGDITTMFPEFLALDATWPLFLWSQDVKSTTFPDYDAGKAQIYVYPVVDVLDAGACASRDGMVFSLLGHPEAVVHYWTNDSPPVLSATTSTTIGGSATISGVAAPTLVTLVATKVGCHVDALPGTTGRLPLEVGAVTYAQPHLRP